MTQKPLPLFESVAAIFGIALISLLVAFPSAGSSEAEAQERVLRDHLEQVRIAVQAMVDSGEAIPADSAELQQLLLDRFLVEIPRNPVNARNTIRVNNRAYFEAHPNGSAGWLYVPGSQSVVPDLPDRDRNGRSYMSY